MLNLKLSLFIFLIGLILSPSLCLPQENRYDGVYRELFLGRQPSARSEAMGRCFSAMSGDINSYFFNPAGLATTEGLNLNFTYANPFYLATDAYYIYSAVSYKIKEVGTVGLSRDYFTIGEVFVANEFGEIQYSYEPGLTNYRLSAAREITDGFFAGVNFNLLHDDRSNFLVIENRAKNTFFLDLGLLKTFNIDTKKLIHRINTGGSIININHASIKYDSQIITTASYLPVILRLGSAYFLTIKDRPAFSGLTNYQLILTTEFQRILNSKKLNEVKAGFEFNLFELLALRMGYYYQVEHECENCKSYINELTYGLGLNIPAEKFSNSKLPLTINLDYARMNQPSFVTNISNWDNFNVYNLRLRWLIK